MCPVVGCQNAKNIIPAITIIGKWQPTNELQSLQPDGTWSAWSPKSDFKSLPTYKFTKKGRFLLDGEIMESCCQPGSFYKIRGDTLTFNYEKTPDCSTVKCADASTKIILTLTETELILLESNNRYKIKYERVILVCFNNYDYVSLSHKSKDYELSSKFEFRRTNRIKNFKTRS